MVKIVGFEIRSIELGLLSRQEISGHLGNHRLKSLFQGLIYNETNVEIRNWLHSTQILSSNIKVF